MVTQSIATDSKLLQVYLTRRDIKFTVYPNVTIVELRYDSDLFWHGYQYAEFCRGVEHIKYAYNLIYKVDDDLFVNSMDEHEAKSLDEAKAHIDYLTK